IVTNGEVNEPAPFTGLWVSYLNQNGLRCLVRPEVLLRDLHGVPITPFVYGVCFAGLSAGLTAFCVGSGRCCAVGPGLFASGLNCASGVFGTDVCVPATSNCGAAFGAPGNVGRSTLAAASSLLGFTRILCSSVDDVLNGPVESPR